jgi:DNA-directed RNA polymerase specialized sigma24 family protein
MTMPADKSASYPRLCAAGPPGAATSGGAAPGVRGQTPDETVTVMYRAHYAALVRLAAVLIGDVATAEDVVQDSFIAMHGTWWRLRDTARALPYLRRSVINRSRSVLRHRAPGRHHPRETSPARARGTPVIVCP